MSLDGEPAALDTIASEPLRFPDFQNTFERLRGDAQRVFDVRDYERWLDQELEPHTVQVGDMTMARDMKSMADDAAREDDEKLMERAKDLGTKIEEARDHVSKYFNLGKEMEAETQWRLREEEVAARERVVFEHQAREAELLSGLSHRFGVLQQVPNDPFAWTIEWKMAPQQFNINVTCLRGMRRKFDRDGYCVILCSVVDRVGGATIRFSTGEKNLDCNVALPPLRVQNKSQNVDLYVNKTVELLCPAPSLLQTHAVLQFEVWRLRAGKYEPVDKVVGFGYWPLVGKDFRVREGKFKVPLIVGEAEDSVDTYEQMGRLIEGGLQYWFGNLYFEITNVRRNRSEQARDQEDIGGFGGSVEITPEDLRLKRTADDIRSLTFPHLPPRLFFDDVKLGEEGETKAASNDLRDMNKALWEKRSLLEEEKHNLRTELVKRKSRSLANDTNDDDEITEMKMRSDLAKNKVTKRKLPEIAVAEGDEDDKMRDSHILIQQHHFALASQREFFFMGRRFRDNLSIGASVVLYDFGVNKGGPWDKSKVVINIIFFIIGLLARMVVHAVAKYLFLGFLDVPLTREDWNPWYIDLRFDHTSRFYPWDTIGTVAIGFTICIVVYMFLALALFLLLLIFGKIPYTMTRFVLWYGFAVALDPILASIMDAAAGNTASGDTFLLYNQFLREEGTGIHGAAITAFLYMTMEIPHVACMYFFAIYVHLNGRAMDIYKRMTYPESSFYMPHDLELGAVELREVVKAAKAYRTEAGDMKVVHVDEFNHKFICMFRERLFKLLSIMDNNPDTWVNTYFDSIALRRPRHARKLIEDNLGSFVLGSDVLLFMRRNFPHLCMFTRGHVGDRDEDFYYESDLIRGISSHSTALEDEKEMREFLKSYFMAQIYGEKPVEWSMEDPKAFIIKDKQLLADLIFFETSGDAMRSFRLFRRLMSHVDGYMSIDPEEPESWRPCIMPNFDRNEPLRSIEGKEAEGVVIHITFENFERNTKQLQRIFVVTPTGCIFEPTQSSFSFQTQHTADHVEFWAAKATLMGKQIENDLLASSM
jgi:hypothetical protein